MTSDVSDQLLETPHYTADDVDGMVSINVRRAMVCRSHASLSQASVFNTALSATCTAWSGSMSGEKGVIRRKIVVFQQLGQV